MSLLAGQNKYICQECLLAFQINSYQKHYLQRMRASVTKMNTFLVNPNEQ
jgi:hypothetical protein